MSKARDGANSLLTIGTTLAAKAPLASPSFTGNVGIGVTPETDWHSGKEAIQLGAGASIYGDTTATGNQISANARATVGSTLNGYKYISTDKASTYHQYDGAHNFRVAPSGTADAAISWNTAMTITNDGRGLSEFTAKAWVNLNGTGTPAIRDSHNISSITDNGTGDYICVFTVAMSNNNYAAVANGSAVNNWRGTETTVITVSTANFRIYHVEDTNTYDTSFITGIVFGA